VSWLFARVSTANEIEELRQGLRHVPGSDRNAQTMLAEILRTREGGRGLRALARGIAGRGQQMSERYFTAVET